MRRFLLVPGILFLFAAYALLNRAGSIRTWIELQSDLDVGEARIQLLETQNELMRTEIQEFEADDFAVERVLREELELAKPGEVLVVLPLSADPPPAQWEPPVTEEALPSQTPDE
ncbi:MAG: septum formation initiator family protein [Deltaproteobacteria bacterium]|nr:septum formation initiator family protein [Deltaproteobacteria bacterium]